MTFNFFYILCVQEMLYKCNTIKAQSSFSSVKTETTQSTNFSHKPFTTTIHQYQPARMANELNITQDFRTMTLNLPANTVTVQLVVKTLKGQYGFCQNNNHRETSFNPWSEDLQPTESFMKVVREMQIKPDKYYLETVMYQTLCENYAFNNYMPKVLVYRHLPPQDNNDEKRTIQSPRPSNWSDDLYIVDDNNNKNMGQTDQSTNQPTTLTGTRVPQDVLADASTTLRLPQTVPQALKIQNRMAKLNKRPDRLTRPGHGKNHRNKMAWNRNKEKERTENGTSILFI